MELAIACQSGQLLWLFLERLWGHGLPRYGNQGLRSLFSGKCAPTHSVGSASPFYPQAFIWSPRSVGLGLLGDPTRPSNQHRRYVCTQGWFLPQ